MKRFLQGVFSILCAGGLLLSSASYLSSAGATVASAEAQARASGNVTLDKDDLDLLLPGGYDQYLALDAVGDVAVQGGTIAIANNKTIYLYNGEEYLTYLHNSAVVQLEMRDDLILFFLDENGMLYTMDCTKTNLLAGSYGISCSAFTLADNTLYYAMSVTGKTNIYEQSSPTQPIETLSSPTTTVPSMTYADGSLYFTDGQTLIAIAGETRQTYALTADIYSIEVLGDTLYYTDKADLYVYDLSSQQTEEIITEDGTNYTALCTDDTSLYVAGEVGTNTNIRQFDTTSGAFTEYEIATASSSQNRLLSATQSIVSGDYLITADQNRVSVYNSATESFLAFHCVITPDYLASDGESILVANGSTIYFYDFEGNALVDSPTADFNGTIMGVACAKGGDYLLITRNVSCYRIDAETFRITERYTKDMVTTACSMGADIYGNVYVEYSDNTIYKYTESQFLSTGGGELYYTFSSAVENISVDFDGNVYGMTDSTLLCSDGTSYTVDPNECLFASTASLQDYAFGFERGTVYFLYDDYILSTDAIDLPCLNNLETGDSYDEIFASADGASADIVSIATLQEGAVLLHFSLEELRVETLTFPYLTYSRAGEEVNAVVLGETEIHSLPYYIVTVFDATTRKYTAGLVLQSACTLMDQSTYTSVPDGYEDDTGYLTNDVSMYKYPYLNDGLIVCSLKKNAAVQVLKELSLGDSLIDYDYYYVSYTDDTGETVYGYVPKNYVRAFDGTATEQTTVYYSTLVTKEDITATSADNKSITLEAGTSYTVAVYQDESDAGAETVLISYAQDGVEYFATVSTDLLQNGTNNLFRYFLIAVLLVLDALIVVNYLVLKRKK